MNEMSMVKVVSGPKSWIEGEAVRQLELAAKLPDMDRVVGMPDLHPGPGHPIGAVFITRDRFYPHLVGSDIGCGIGLWSTSIKPGKADRLAKKLRIEDGMDSPHEYLEQYGVAACGFEHTFGTIGQGNHFAELLVWDQILDQETVTKLVGDSKTMLLVHSGSRGYGEKILREHTALHRDEGIPLHNLSVAVDYLRNHNHAVAWARLNRMAIAHRIFDSLGAVGTEITDVIHNFMEPRVTDNGTVWVHRKGAIPSDHGPVVIPGSRGSHSYLVEPIGDDHEETGWSLSHGAGRKMSRRDARVKFEKGKQSIEKASKTKFNSVVICEDRQTLIEEVPEAYKAIDRVIQDLVDHGLVRILALMKPILTYKVRRNVG